MELWRQLYVDDSPEAKENWSALSLGDAVMCPAFWVGKMFQETQNLLCQLTPFSQGR
jgi:hypothetical protein